MRKISLIGLIVILTAATVNSQDISRIFLKSIDDSTVVMRFGRYRIELREGSDSLRISAGGIYWNAAKVLNAALLDSIHDGLGRFSGDTVTFSYHSPIPTIFEIYIDSATSTNADDSVTFEGTRDDMGVHPDVYSNAAGWPTKHYDGDTLIYSHRFWMVQTPTIGGNYSTEEPTLYYSDDSGTSWYIPYKVDTLGGNTLWVDTPLCPYISPYYNSDPDMIVAEDGKMYVYWRHHYNVSFPDPDTIQVLVKSSSNGIDWGDSTLLWWDTGDAGGGQAIGMSPSVIYDDDGYYRLWAVWVTASDTIVAMLEASTPTGLGHNGDTLYEDDSVHCSFTGVPAGEKPWHINVTKVQGLYAMILTLKKNDETHGYRNYLAVSTDGINWQVSDTITDSSGSGWDYRMVYRGALIPHQIADRFYLDYWYTGEYGNWFIGKTTIEFPTTAAIADSADVAADAYTSHNDKDGDSIDVSAYVTDANLTDTLNSYFDSAIVVDTIQGILVDYVTDANLTDTLNSYPDTAIVHDSLDILRAEMDDSVQAHLHDTANVVRTEIRDTSALIAHDTADLRLLKTGGALTGAVTTNSTFDGVDVGNLNTDVAGDSASWNAAADKFDTNYIQLTVGNILLSNDSISGVDVITADTVVVNAVPIMNYEGTNLSVTAGVLNATGGNFVWQDSAGEPPFWVDSAKYAAASGGFTNAFIPGKLTVTGPIDHYGIMLELDTSMLYCPHADTFLRLPLDTIGIAGAEDTFQMLHPSILPIPEGKWGYRYWFAGTPPDAGIIEEDIHILVSNDEVVWHEFFVGPESTTLSGRPIGYYDSTLHNPVFKATDFDSATYTSDPDIAWDENGDLFVVLRVTRSYNNKSIHYLYSASTNDGLDWTDTVMIIDGYYNKGTIISPDTGTLSLVSPGVVMRGAGDYLMYTTEDTSGSKYTRAAWEAPRIDTTWDNAADFDSTIKFGGGGGDSHRVSIVHQTLPDGNMVWHSDEIIYATDLIVNLVSSYSGTYYPHIYMGLSTDGEYFTTVSTPLLDTTNNQTAWDHNQLYRSSGYFVNLNGEMVLRLYYSATDNDGDWYTGLTNVHFGKVLKKLEVLIWNPDLITDTVPAFGDVDSAMCPGGIQIHSLAVQTSVDGTYALKFMSFTAADPPVFHDWIDTLNVGASDQRASSKEVDFEDDNSQMVDRGQSVYILTPSTDIDWIRVSVKYFVRDWE